MFFYLTIFFFVVYLALIRQKVIENQRILIDFVMLFVLACVTGFRAIGGSDFGVYVETFSRVPKFSTLISDIIWYQDNLFHMEIGYLVIISILKTIGFSFEGYLLLQSIFIYTFLYWGLRKYTRYWGIVMVVFLYKMFFYDTFISMRQPITVVLFFYIMHLIFEKRQIKYLLCLLLIMPIHNGALLLPFIYFINFFKISRKRLVLLSILFLPTVFLTKIGIVSSAVDLMNYIGGEKTYSAGESLSIFYTLEYYFIMVLVITNYNRIINIDKYSTFIVKLFLIILPLVTVFRQIVILRRELDYFILVYAIIIGYLCDIHKKYRFIILCSTILICLYGYIRYLKNFDDGGLIPYKSWLYTQSFIN